MFKKWMLLLVLSLSVCAGVEVRGEYSKFTSADGIKQIEAKPLKVKDGKVHFERPGGSQFLAPLDSFSADDQVELKKWIAALDSNLHVDLLERVKLAKTLRVLFVGNSYSFKIPQAFERLAEAEGQRVVVEQVTSGGWTLKKHAASEATLAKIRKGSWDIVVLQEQSLVPAIPDPQRSNMMYPAAKSLVAEVKAAGAIPVLFLTWGRRDGDKQNAATFPNDTYAAMQQRLIEGYETAAREAGGVFIVPVGKVWSKVRAAGKDAKIYAPDGSHPMPAGNYLAACVFYSTFYGQEVERVERKVKEAKFFAEVAAEVKRPSITYPVK